MTKNFDIQDEILFELALDSANRLGAIHALSLSKLDLENNMFTDIREKRGYRVEVVFSDKTKEIIEEWLDERKEGYDKLEVDSLFVTLHDGEHKQMSKGTIQYRMKKLASAVGIENFYFHCLRKSSLNNIYNETGDISLAQQLANHKNISTTFAHYVKPKSKKEVLAKIKELREKRD
jgi:integrase/recombinase XerC